MQRRTFLRNLTGLGVGLGAGIGTLLAPRTGRAFGMAPSTTSAVLPSELRVESVLEIFLCGGVSQYESFYCVPTHGASDRTHYHLYADTQAFADELAKCGFSGAPTQAFGTDALGQSVELGPFVAPLRARPDVLERLSVSLTAHELAPHEAAIPLALSGRALGNPALAGLGAHVQRYFGDLTPSAAGPVAYALLSTSLGALPIDNLRAVTATGLHPASAQPLAVTVDAASDLVTLLARDGVGSHRTTYDALVADYVADYESKLRFKGEGATLRCHPFADFATSTRFLSRVDDIRARLDPASIVASPGTSCGETAPTDAVAMQLRLAAHLLTRPTEHARYVCVVDGGLIPLTNGGGAYDSHSDNTVIQARNLMSTLGNLMAIVKQPGETAPDKLDLDRTLIVLTTEFGRSPTAEGTSGRNHWPYGYANALLGGPVRARRIVGACDATATGVALPSPAETRMAALLALGVWPFAAEGFNVADVAGAHTEEEAAATILERQFGLAT